MLAIAKDLSYSKSIDYRPLKTRQDLLSHIIIVGCKKLGSGF